MRWHWGHLGSYGVIWPQFNLAETYQISWFKILIFHGIHFKYIFVFSIVLIRCLRFPTVLPRWTATAVLTTSLLRMSVAISKLVKIWCICEFLLKGCHFGVASLRWFLEQFLGPFILDKHHWVTHTCFISLNRQQFMVFRLIFTQIADSLPLKPWNNIEKFVDSQLLKIMNIPEFKSSFLSQNWHNSVPKIKSKSIFLWWPIRALDFYESYEMVNYEL